MRIKADPRVRGESERIKDALMNRYVVAMLLVVPLGVLGAKKAFSKKVPTVFCKASGNTTRALPAPAVCAAW